MKPTFAEVVAAGRLALRASLIRNLRGTGGARAIRMRSTKNAARTLIITRNLGDGVAGQAVEFPWRATSIDEIGPWGHTVHRRQSDAIRSYSGQRLRGCADGHPGEWETVEVRR